MDERDYSFWSMWPDEVAELGFTMVPNGLLRYYPQLYLKPSEFLVLINIQSYWWRADCPPFPSVELLAKRTGLTKRTVTRIITALQDERGLLQRIKRKNTSNEYSFDPLCDKLVKIILADKSGQSGGRKRHGRADDFISSILSEMSS